MKKILITSFAASLLLFSYSCDTDFENDVNDIQVTSGTANFSKYVALGNSLTSGYRDGALYMDGQVESYPNMIAAQMKLAGGGEFKQPLMPNNIGGFTNLNPLTNQPIAMGKLQLKVVNGSLAPVPTAPGAALDMISSGGPYQNLGVPGAKVGHLLYAGFGNPAGLMTGTANPYYIRFATSPTASVVQDAMAQNPTFFSLWIGNNDVLGYSTTGGDGTDPITPEADFTTAYTALINTLTSGGAKGVIANIPNVTSIPFFNTVPYNPVPLDAATVTQLNQQVFGPLKQILSMSGDGGRFVTLSTANNPLLIKDESLPNRQLQITQGLVAGGVPAQQAGLMGIVFGQARHATSADLVLLTTSSVIGTAPGSPYAVAPFNKYGVTFPLEDKHVLRGKFETQTSNVEVDDVLAATAAYNATIKSLADSKGLAFFDANAKMGELAKISGITFDGVKYTAKFVTGGTFSLDGVHLTGRGYGVIANEFLKAINNKYGSNLPLVNVNSYSGVTFP
jgi:lysophospholipase L1-like esterase